MKRLLQGIGLASMMIALGLALAATANAQLGGGGDDGLIEGGGVSFPLLADDGTTGAPSVAFADDADTGIWSSVDGRINFSTDGTERLELGNAFVQVASGAGLTFEGAARIYPNGTTNIRLLDITSADFGLLQFGGTTSSYPAIKRSSAALQFRLADDSAFANLQAEAITPAIVTADPCGTFPEGAIFYNDTSDYHCFCNGSGVDLKFTDHTTACF